MGDTLHKFQSVGDWEVLYVNGESVKQNHQGRVAVLDYIDEGMEIDVAVSKQVNLPEGKHRYPDQLTEVIEDERYDFDGGDR